ARFAQPTASRSTTNTSGSCGLITPPAPRAPHAIAERISRPAPPPPPPALHARVPSRDHLPFPELELERTPAVPRCVELVAGRERDADVVHRHLLARDRLLAVADDEVVDTESERDVAFGLVDLRTFWRHAGILADNRRPWTDRPPSPTS